MSGGLRRDGRAIAVWGTVLRRDTGDTTQNTPMRYDRKNVIASDKCRPIHARTELGHPRARVHNE
eukprot:1178872-Prorocentrum_minimum.AAC.4